MPELNTSLHTDMLGEFRRQNSLPRRLYRALRRELGSPDVYGTAWGDPENVAPLRFVANHWVRPYVAPDGVTVEIGPGGGRWTRYLLDSRRLYVVDFYPELLAELRKTFDRPNMVFIRNNGTDFPGIETKEADYIFSFGTFVHLEPHLIRSYLTNMRDILKPGGNVVLHYSDKSKIMARKNPTFVDTTPELMRSMVGDAGFQVVEEDLTTLWHSSLIRLTV